MFFPALSLMILRVLESVFQKRHLTMENRTPDPRFFSLTVDDTNFRIRNELPFVQTIFPHISTWIHDHPSNELHCILRGSEQITTLHRKTQQEKRFVLTENQICLIPAHIIHSTYTPDSLSYLSFMFDIQPASHNQHISKSSMFSSLSAYLTRAEDPLILQNEELTATLNLLRQRFHASERGAYFCNTHKHQMLISRIILILADELLKCNDVHPYRFSSEISDRDREYIIQDFLCHEYASSNALSALSERLHLSERQTQTVVERLTGKNFKSLILEQKMSFAKLLIENTTFSLNKIAESVGYNSYGSFFTAYRNYYGLSPMEHRLKSKDMAQEPKK